MVIRPPKIKDGYLTREAFDDFFSQVYLEANSLLQHAARLHARLINASWFGPTIVLEIRCQMCGGDMRTKSCISTNISHMGEKERKKMEISVSSLRKLTLQQFKDGTTHVGQAGYDDFELLLKKLHRNNL